MCKEDIAYLIALGVLAVICYFFSIIVQISIVLVVVAFIFGRYYGHEFSEYTKDTAQILLWGLVISVCIGNAVYYVPRINISFYVNQATTSQYWFLR